LLTVLAVLAVLVGLATPAILPEASDSRTTVAG
jgi:hypothetical protein